MTDATATLSADDPKFAGYANPNVLVTTQWVADHLDDPKVRIVESDEDILLYDIGHIPGAVKLDWETQLQDRVVREFLTKDEFEDLMAERGIANDTTVVIYGDKNNWYATYALWLFKYYGHDDVRIMDGGRIKWEKEGRAWERAVPAYEATTYTAQEADPSIRARRDDVLKEVLGGTSALVDVRSPAEYTGELLHAIGYPQEGAQRAGHVKGAKNIPWGTAAQEDGTYKPVEELRALYTAKGIDGEKPVIAYCRIGERSSHTWFALTYLLGYDNVRNYDGSWTEWGSLVGVPNEQGTGE
ncbi:MAG: sulfurtransferase [Thermomicrobiales bacterium]